MQGASPLASPGLNPRGTGSTCRCRRLNGGRAPGVAGSASVSGTQRGLAFFVARRPCLSLAFLPLSPRPPSQWEGGDQGYFMQGASPLASPRLNPRGTGSICRCRRLNGGRAPGVAGSASVSGARRMACLLCRPPPPPLACFSAPYPPARARRAIFPGGEGGDFRLFYARGFAPCIPGTEPGRHWLFLWKAVPEGGLVPGVAGWLCCAGARGGLAFRLACRPCLELTFLPPSPRPALAERSSRREGEVSKFILPGASPPAPLRPGGKRHWLCFWKTVLLAFREKVFHSGQGNSSGAGFSNAARVQAGFKTHSRSG